MVTAIYDILVKAKYTLLGLNYQKIICNQVFPSAFKRQVPNARKYIIIFLNFVRILV